MNRYSNAKKTHLNKLLLEPARVKLRAYAHEQERGFILLLTLFISFILAFVLSVELLTIRLNSKSFSADRQQSLLFHMIEKNRVWGMRQHSILSSACLFLASSPNEYPLKLKSKQIVGCMKKEDNVAFYAVSEDLGIFSCTHWYRLTLMGEDEFEHQIVLQTVFTELEHRLSDQCKDAPTVGKIGQQSWRIA